MISILTRFSDCKNPRFRALFLIDGLVLDEVYKASSIDKFFRSLEPVRCQPLIMIPLSRSVVNCKGQKPHIRWGPGE